MTMRMWLTQVIWFKLRHPFANCKNSEMLVDLQQVLLKLDNELDRWRKIIGPRKKKKLDRWKGEVGETIRFKHSKFAHKYFRHNQKIIFSLLVSCCGFRPWCQQDRTMRRFEFQSMTIFCIQYQFGATLQYLKVLLK